ncbi:hypothetical protein [Altererythrobacter sp. ZODW24]|uniref:hypothetical protein n=1 Tax=Altererythrobacter sp. ZODW24 TaxID=2185142 RepID=UPI001F080BA9|nr:hypothetical protein [Altererythrobacter sp. ZODW24]
MTDTAEFEPPKGPLVLSGPQTRPAPGTLPIRGDLAHIGLAGKYFVPHYAVPQPRIVVAAGAAMLEKTDTGSDVVKQLEGGTEFGLLDIEGDWAWGALSAEGPSGWVKLEQLTDLT